MGNTLEFNPEFSELHLRPFSTINQDMAVVTYNILGGWISSKRWNSSATSEYRYFKVHECNASSASSLLAVIAKTWSN